MSGSNRNRLKSNTYATAGVNAAMEVQRLLKPVRDISATGFTRPRNLETSNCPKFEAPITSAARLIALLDERGERLEPWTRWGKRAPPREVLFFSNDRDAVLARLLLAE